MEAVSKIFLKLRLINSEVYVKPMKDPLVLSPSKGNQGTTRGKEKILLTSVGVGRVRVRFAYPTIQETISSSNTMTTPTTTLMVL